MAQQEFEEIVVGADLNEANSLIFAEFKEKFAEYIFMESSPQTALLNDEFFANEEKATEEMRVWLNSKGISEDEWSFQ